MRVLSLFDGMSCGQIALRQLGIKVDTYYASEVDKFAIAQTMLNFPDTIQLCALHTYLYGQRVPTDRQPGRRCAGRLYRLYPGGLSYGRKGFEKHIC